MDYLEFSIYKKLMGNLRQIKTPKPLSAKSISLAKSSMRSFRGKRSLFLQQRRIGGNGELTFLHKIRAIGIIKRSANYTRLMFMMSRKRIKSFGWSFWIEKRDSWKMLSVSTWKRNREMKISTQKIHKQCVSQEVTDKHQIFVFWTSRTNWR